MPKRLLRKYTPGSSEATTLDEAVKYLLDNPKKTVRDAEKKFKLPHATIHKAYEKIYGKRPRPKKETAVTKRKIAR